MIKFLRSYVFALYLNRLFYGVFCGIVILALFSFFISPLRPLIPLLFLVFALLSAIDYLALFTRKGIESARLTPERLSNGDDNSISIRLENRYPFPVQLEILDELPVQLQIRDFHLNESLSPAEIKTAVYMIRPVKRGQYEFGKLNIYARGPLRLVSRRYLGAEPVSLPVYPSFLQMRQYSLLAFSRHSSRYGFRKIRKTGQSREYDQIHEYVEGDDVRTINWKASARSAALMVNHYTDEKAQQIYCIIDKGRAMKTPVEGLSLMDYAINASLVLSSIALQNKDKAGLITYSEVMGSWLGADSKAKQLDTIAGLLHNERSRFLESSAEMLYVQVRRKISQRSLLVLFTHFDSVTALRRQLPYLKKMNSWHLLLVVFFQDTELSVILEEPAKSLDAIYTRTIAGRFASEKRLILKELRQAGILGLLSKPQGLSMNAINKYLEIKQRNLL